MEIRGNPGAVTVPDFPRMFLYNREQSSLLYKNAPRDAHSREAEICRQGDRARHESSTSGTLCFSNGMFEGISCCQITYSITVAADCQKNGYIHFRTRGKSFMDAFSVYKDIQTRTNGQFLIGVVGPVRTGKSTFIKRFMNLMVLPNIEDENERSRANDELPQSSSGRTIMTTEPKFVPNEAVSIRVDDEIDLNVRLIDCVGYMVDGAAGHMEENEERLVKTPWFEYEIPFTKAAAIGTKKSDYGAFHHWNRGDM